MKYCAAFLLALILVSNIGCQGQVSTRQMPNIVFILADDLGYGDLKAFNPQAQIPTPAISRLAEHGVRFTNAHSASAVCTPSRYGILTGRYAFRSQLKKGVLGGYSPALIEDSRFTLADLVHNAGYHTGIIGKWHLGLDWNPLDPSKPPMQLKGEDADFSNVNFAKPVLNGPNNLGFDYSYILPASLDMSPYLYLENGVVTDSPVIPVKGDRSERGIFWREGWGSKSFDIYKTLDHFTGKAQQFIREATKNKEKPFFLYVTLTAPHTPWLPAEKFKGVSKAGLYGDFVAHTDDAVGRIMATLDSLNMTENTIVIVTSDNGADWKNADRKKFPDHQANYIFRGEKSDIWEGGHHIPLIISWPGKIAGNREAKAIFCLNDFMATLAEMTQQKLPDGAGPDSYNYWPLIMGKDIAERPSIIHHSNEGMFAIRKEKWKFIDGNGSGGWSPARPDDKAPGQLYNMEADERETVNLYDQYPEIVKELKSLLDRQKKQGYSVNPTR